jgi:hypothetical protein
MEDEYDPFPWASSIRLSPLHSCRQAAERTNPPEYLTNLSSGNLCGPWFVAAGDKPRVLRSRTITGTACIVYVAQCTEIENGEDSVM